MEAADKILLEGADVADKVDEAPFWSVCVPFSSMFKSKRRQTVAVSQVRRHTASMRSLSGSTSWHKKLWRRRGHAVNACNGHKKAF